MDDKFTISDKDFPVLTIQAPKANYNIKFHNDGEQIGCLDFNGPEMTFTGAADESACVFFDFIAEKFAQRLKDERVKKAMQIIELAEHKAKRAQEYSDRAEEDDGEPDYHAEGIADGLLNLVREIRQTLERGE